MCGEKSESHWSWRLASWAGFLRKLLGMWLLCIRWFLLGSFAFPGQKDECSTGDLAVASAPVTCSVVLLCCSVSRVNYMLL